MLGRVLPLLFFVVAVSEAEETVAAHLTTDDAGYLTVIQGFATQLQCLVDTCTDKVLWYKDDILLFNGTEFQKDSHLDEAAFVLNHNADIDEKRGCRDECKSSSDCETGFSCIENQCCACKREDYSLVLRNLTFEDSGRYRCQISNTSEQLEFQVEVLESGLRGGFHENISYDHSKCCQDKGISNMCRAMCKPSDMGNFHFDPTSCKTDDYKNFLSCATDGGKRSHVHCCKIQMVPSFCYDFCSADFQMLRRSHRLCLYYLPEIFECYNRAYLPYPDAPEDVMVNAIEHNQLSVCWKPPPIQPTNKDFPVKNYTVFYKQILSFPFFPGLDDSGSDLPFLAGGDYGELTDIIDDDYEINGEINGDNVPSPPTLPPVPALRPKRWLEKREIEVEINGKRVKRQTMVLVTRDESSNTTTVREFKYENVTTNATCFTLKDLRSATRYSIYVTARNDYGESVPSLRSVTLTNVHTITNGTSLPNTPKCCREANVSEFCAAKMCDPTQSVNLLSTISISTGCRQEWPKVSPCIADGRNHTECCKKLGVQAECLPVCAGSTEELSMNAMLCLNLDLSTIYQCMREGYETHPSPPMNVTVDQIKEKSVVISWSDPAANSHLVESFTILLKRNLHGAEIKRFENVTSPYKIDDLEMDASYTVSVKSHSFKGTSLPSTAILFQTAPPMDQVCPIGEPLLLDSGARFRCSDNSPCPLSYTCTEFDDSGYCCLQQSETSTDFHSCCSSRSLKDECLETCLYNSTSFPETCISHLNTWVQCGSEGHDHSRCCEQSGLPKECMTGCRHPFELPENCSTYTEKLRYCFATHLSRQPTLVKNLHTVRVGEKNVVLVWDASMNANEYEVQLFDIDNTTRRKNVTKPRYEITDLAPGREYKARVIAFNVASSSPPSWNISFITLPEDSIANEPLAPSGLKIVWNYGTRVNVTWQKVNKKMDGSALGGKPEYAVSYICSDHDNTWAVIKTNETWVVLTHLIEDKRYLVYVVATVKGQPSKSSSVITILAQQDSMGLPEPTIKLMPNEGVYKIGEKITVECSVETNEKNLSIEITSAGKRFHNDRQMNFLSKEIEISKEIDTIACLVSDKDGRQNVQMRNIVIIFGPILQVDRGIVHAFDDMSARISCTVSGFPIPNVHFEKDSKSIGHGHGEEIKIRNPSIHTYQYTLILRNATNQAGLYHCIAERNGTHSEGIIELITEKPIELPVNPRKIFNCCKEKGITGDCLEACAIGKVASNLTCKEHAKSMLKCADDVRDHSDCCVMKGVKGRCLALCSGDSVAENVDCTQYALPIMECFIISHESSPQQPQNLDYKPIDTNKIRVTWGDPSAANNLVFYAIYYKKRDTEDDFTMVKTATQSVELKVDSESTYEIGIIAANAFGHSPIKFLTSSPFTYSRSDSNNSFLYIVFLLVACSIVVIGIMLLGKRKNLVPAIFKRQQFNNNDPTVAFENPAFNSEVEIRGLGDGGARAERETDWHSQDLQPSNATDRNGMRYSKLET
ncbi:unnamed protein product, partial [Mesorhabditis belari]|uniref:Ig-like and fibronectin type-III domain-containing protein C25G4.10 n=1 Tax=Mesorhabditis belari TaxID=2138241 RepID=A0AAF3FKP5_9BILA